MYISNRRNHGFDFNLLQGTLRWCFCGCEEEGVLEPEVNFDENVLLSLWCQSCLGYTNRHSFGDDGCYFEQGRVYGMRERRFSNTVIMLLTTPRDFHLFLFSCFVQHICT